MRQETLSSTGVFRLLFFPSLQNIFQGKDIREQLPKECKEFEEASLIWKTIMSHLHQHNKALEGTHHPGRFPHMDSWLEQLQLEPPPDLCRCRTII